MGMGYGQWQTEIVDDRAASEGFYMARTIVFAKRWRFGGEVICRLVSLVAFSSSMADGAGA